MGLTYAQRKNKNYKHKWTNAHQTNEERRQKYAMLRAKGFNAKSARQLRDVRKTILQRDKILG